MTCLRWKSEACSRLPLVNLLGERELRSKRQRWGNLLGRPVYRRLMSVMGRPIFFEGDACVIGRMIRLHARRRYYGGASPESYGVRCANVRSGFLFCVDLRFRGPSGT